VETYYLGFGDLDRGRRAHVHSVALYKGEGKAKNESHIFHTATTPLSPWAPGRD
jgi:hypothetical protein